MSVISPIVDSWDGANRLIYLKSGVLEYFPIEDIYHEYREARMNNEELRKFSPLLRAEGNVPKGAGAFTPRYMVLLDGTKIVPFDEPSQLSQLGDIITDDPDVDPTLYDISSLSVPKVIYIKPSEAEVIQLNSESIQYSSYGGAVNVDSSSVNSGTDYPVGNVEYPVNNIPDARAIAIIKGFNTIKVTGNLTLTTGDDISGFMLIGDNAERSLISIEDGANTTSCEIRNAYITGTLDSGIIIRDCAISDLIYVDGIIHQTVLNPGTIVLGNNSVGHFLDCFSGVPGLGTPIIDMGGSGQALAMRNYNGGIELINKSGPESVSLDINSGQVVLADTVTDGTIVVRGVGKITDNSIGANVLCEDLINKDNLASAIWSAPSIDHSIVGTKGGDVQDISSAMFGDAVFDQNTNVLTVSNTEGDEIASYNMTIVEGATIKKERI